MIETISPVVHGGRNRTYLAALGVHILGTTLSAAALGTILGGLGGALGAPWARGMWAVAAVAGLYAVRELALVPIPLPDLDKQVPDWWRTFFSRKVAAFLYGLGLGVGFFTYLSFGTLAAVGVAAFVSGDMAVGALVMGLFGLARGLSVSVATVSSPERTLDLLERPRLRRAAGVVNGSVLAGIAFVALYQG